MLGHCGWLEVDRRLRKGTRAWKTINRGEAASEFRDPEIVEIGPELIQEADSFSPDFGAYSLLSQSVQPSAGVDLL